MGVWSRIKHHESVKYSPCDRDPSLPDIELVMQTPRVKSKNCWLKRTIGYHWYNSTPIEIFDEIYFDPYKDPKLRRQYPDYDSTSIGIATRWYETGQLKAVQMHKNGKKHGEYKSFHPRGVLKTICYYDNGMLSGRYEKFDEEGRILELCTFVNNKKEGEHTFVYGIKYCYS